VSFGENFKGAVTILRALLDANLDKDVRASIIELQSAILDAQQSALESQDREVSLSRELRNSEAEIAKLRASTERTQQYKLHDVGDGTFVRQFLVEDGSKEPAHNACCGCFEDGFISVLQCLGGDTQGGSNWRCYRCETSLFF